MSAYTAASTPTRSTHTRSTRAILAPPRRPAQPIWALRPIAVTGASLGLVLVIVLGTSTRLSADLHQPGGILVYLGGMAGLVGMYLALVQLLLISRIPAIEGCSDKTVWSAGTGVSVPGRSASWLPTPCS